MFDSRVAFLGMPANGLVLVVAVAASIIGLVWMRRMLTIEPETHSFRATSPRTRRAGAVAATGLVIAGVLLVLAALGAIRLS